MMQHTRNVNHSIMLEHHSRQYWQFLLGNSPDESKEKARNCLTTMASTLPKVVDAYVDLLYFQFGDYADLTTVIKEQMQFPSKTGLHRR